MKNFLEWAKDNDLEIPEHEINGSWFSAHGLPMIVECTCCSSTMALPSAMIDDGDRIFCLCCAGEE